MSADIFRLAEKVAVVTGANTGIGQAIAIALARAGADIVAVINEWAARGIRVNAIAPGYCVTNNTEALRADAARNRDILARIPAGRWGTPDDIGVAAVFLASEAARYVHGVVLPVDGGWLAR
jgi:NAD(P)-dependent dehydrogenase (short-subunit alcohol dehydrogenase family)